MVRRNPKRKCHDTADRLAADSIAKYGRPSYIRSSAGYTNVDLYTSYLGKVTTRVYNFGNGNVALQAPIDGLDGKPIYVKCVDAQVNRLSQHRQYDVRQLAGINPTMVNVEYNTMLWNYLQTIGEHDKELKHPILTLLNPVDVHFMTCDWIEFMHTVLKINGMNDDGVLVSLHNFPRLDNAFNTGSYMIYGNGDRSFFPMGCLDVTGHELVHGLTQTLSGLKYEGESGALNESFSDVLGCTFEHWTYRKYNINERTDDDILGEFDWLMGEDVGKGMKYLRSMSDPHNATRPQPKKYKGKYWIDTGDTSPQNDYGGVHCNSGVPNHCFYLFAQRIGMYRALKIFVMVLKNMKPDSQFADFARELVTQSTAKHRAAAIEVLAVVGL